MSRPRRSDRVLNLMCGSGTLLVERLARGRPALAVGCDLDPAALAGARRNLASAGLAGAVALVRMDATALGVADGQIDVLLADLSSQASVRRAAEEYQRGHDRLHVLVNNAGGYWATRHVTVDGLELTFALNHLAYFLLTNLLLDLLRASAPARIVNVTSGAQALGDIHLDDLQFQRHYRGRPAYNQSKLANVLFTYELARRLEGTGVTVNCVHPGVVRSNFGRDDLEPVMRLLTPLVRPFMRSPERGADTSVWLASSPEVEGVTGRYFTRRQEKRSSRRSYDTQLAGRLWWVSEELTGLRQPA